MRPGGLPQNLGLAAESSPCDDGEHAASGAKVNPWPALHERASSQQKIMPLCACA